MPLFEVMLLLAIATGGVLVGRFLRAPAIVAYLVTGVLVGPGGLGLVERTHALEQLAELGVALLLFGVGIEFSLDRLRKSLLRIIGSGALQVVLTVLGTALAFRAMGLSWGAAWLVGFLVALSSTAVVFKLYGEAGELDAPHGHAASGILLFQDLALVPMMLLVPVLASPGDDGLIGAAAAVGSAGAAIGVLLLVARVVLPRALQLVARAGSVELFPLSALVIAFGTAAAATQLGLSLPIGAFLAGLALSGSPYAQQVFAELVPLRDAFVAIFFTIVGMLVHPALIAADPAPLAGMLLAVAGKGALVACVVGLLWRSWRVGVLTAFGLAQVGEFSVVLARVGVGEGLLEEGLEQALLGATILTMAATPFMMRLGQRIVAIQGSAGEGHGPDDLRDHVLVIGHGETGRSVARVLRETGIPFVSLDLLAEEVERGLAERLPIHFGDATRRLVLRSIGAGRARAAVVALGDPTSTRRVVSLLRQLNQEMRILVRARRVDEVAELERLGADEVVPSEFETSIELFSRLLTRLGVPRHVVRVQESVIRLGHYQTMRGGGLTPELLAQTEKLVVGGILETAQVMEGSAAAGQTLASLDLRSRTGAQILSIVRDEQPLPPPGPETLLEQGDLVVLYGPHAAIDAALHLLEPSEAAGSEGHDA